MLEKEPAWASSDPRILPDCEDCFSGFQCTRLEYSSNFVIFWFCQVVLFALPSCMSEIAWSIPQERCRAFCYVLPSSIVEWLIKRY